MDIQRILRHLTVSNRLLRRAFPTAALDHIEQAVASSEFGHLGQIHFAVEIALPIRALLRGQSASDRALDLFAQLHVWDTEHNNGILIYLLLADRALEIVADRGIRSRVDPKEWEHVANAMAQAFRRQDFEAGVIEAVQSLHLHLKRHFPGSHPGDRVASSGGTP